MFIFRFICSKSEKNVLSLLLHMQLGFYFISTNTGFKQVKIMGIAGMRLVGLRLTVFCCAVQIDNNINLKFV